MTIWKVDYGQRGVLVGTAYVFGDGLRLEGAILAAKREVGLFFHECIAVAEVDSGVRVINANERNGDGIEHVLAALA